MVPALLAKDDVIMESKHNRTASQRPATREKTIMMLKMVTANGRQRRQVVSLS
jgi:hypothetical protein